tara:strand:- start:35 stop:523 length:489 start_codon:yes stop_codon:yes gene_type:complete
MNCFLDRDGIFNIDNHYIGTKDRFIWYEEIFEILDILYLKGYKLKLITNQSGISRGLFSLNDFLELSFYFLETLEKKGFEIEIRFCPHLPSDNCFCRKPKPNMILCHTITSNDIFIGDKESDMQAAFLAKIPNRWIISSNPSGPFTRSFCNHNELVSFLKNK